MATFTKSAAVAVVEKSMRDMGKVQELMTASAVVALISGVTVRDLRDLLTSGVDAISEGMTGKLVPLAVRIKGEYVEAVEGMTAAAARDHIGQDITARKIAAGNFNALTCRAKGEFTPGEKRAVTARDNASGSTGAAANVLSGMVEMLPEGDIRARLDKAAKEAASAVVLADKAEMTLAEAEGVNLAAFAPVVARVEAALGLAEAVLSSMDQPEAEADKPEAEADKPEAAPEAEADPIGVICGQIVALKTRDSLDRIKAALAEAEAALAEAETALAEAEAGSAPVLAEKARRKAA